MCFVMILGALPVSAAGTTEGKNEVLLGNISPNATFSLPERIAKLKTEIAKGERVYTPEDLKLLKRKLKEDEEVMRLLNRPGRN